MKTIPTTEAHIEAIKLRPSDIAEGFLSSGKSPKEALKFSVEESIWSYTVVGDDGKLLGVFGLARYEEFPLVGCPWFVCSDDLFLELARSKQNQVQFLRGCKEWVALMNKAFPVLTNLVDIHNVSAHRWLKWLGFEFHRTIPNGPFNHPFIQFVKCVNLPQS